MLTMCFKVKSVGSSCCTWCLSTGASEKVGDEAIGVKKGEIYVVFQPTFHQYNYGLPVVVSVFIVQNRTRPARQSLDEVIRHSSCRVVTV